MINSQSRREEDGGHGGDERDPDDLRSNPDEPMGRFLGGDG